MSDDANAYRANAMECLKRADYANSAAQRDRLAALALTWMTLASQTEVMVAGYNGDARGWERLQVPRSASR